MTAYKYLIIGVPLLLFIYAGYYFNSSGGGDLLTKAFNQTVQSKEGVTLIQLFAGQYECLEDGGCMYPVKLLLIDDTTFELTYTNTENEEVVTVAQGTWGIAQKNKLVLLTDKRFSLASVPSSMHGTIDTLKIKEFSKKKALFPWMQNPAFTRTSS
ncbi:MAG: hypothetical protein KBC21_02560 [Candidatus Pacebacteria bacterium]|jgi:hypothetical protein|nr:hypothetical protein [Candidatus Paceibacterota bacterium]